MYGDISVGQYRVKWKKSHLSQKLFHAFIFPDDYQLIEVGPHKDHGNDHDNFFLDKEDKEIYLCKTEKTEDPRKVTRRSFRPTRKGKHSG